MKNRLEVARDLLRDDGVIFVQIDDNEQAYLKVLMDEIFGRENFVNCIAVKMSEASGVKMNHAKLKFPKLKEYILMYQKGGFKGFNNIDKYKIDEWDNENNIFLEGLSIEDRNTLIDIELKEENSPEDVDNANNIFKKIKRVSLSEKLMEISFDNDEAKMDWLFDNSYRIIKTAGSAGYAKIVKSLSIIPNQDIAVALSTKNTIFYYITDFNRDVKQPRLQVLFADASVFKNPCDFWQDIKTTGAIANEGGVKMENGKKPEKILHRIIKMTTNPNDIVLDYHLGSGTTCAVAHKMGRRWIGIEQMDYIDDITKVRLQKVLDGEQGGISKAVNWQGGGSFVYLELKKYNQYFIDKILQAQTMGELDTVYNDMAKNAFFKFWFDKDDFQKQYKKDADDKQISLDDRKKILIEVLDENQLYLNYADIDDTRFNVSDDDKALSKAFYGA
ncbi:Type III restriction-modification system methylation subunit [Moraxella catarrhalis]|uniref:Methyltransferase n=2 Tax=Moraxella catarrhalis TaxID=480 RepID=A0A198UJ03_MORCA|nr:Type III restriction-modification system methylation subunit [Moraxella catarrhalis]OAU97276.1 Type III restriction-modification system methylation subunit [Moraxella catarrhalis]OAV04640.1 Type III restriction-modification system methylation subunit [Moraxella catarrhalis]